MDRHRLSASAITIWRRVLSPAAVVGSVIALAAGASAGAQPASRASGPGAAAAVRSASGPGAAPVAASSPAGTWRLLPRAPVTRSPGDLTAVWTGKMVIIHGNYSGSQGGIRGVTFGYRPATGRWARLAGGPARASAFETTDVAVWTGSRVLVAGQTSAIYNPAADTWRPMPLAPMSMFGAVTGWTGHVFLAWGGTCCEDTSRGGFAYNPAASTWAKLPAAPLPARRDASGTWTGRELVVAGGFTTARRPARALRDGAAYNPVTGTWRKIAPMPLDHWGARAVWDGTEVLFIGGSIGAPGTGTRLAARGLAYNPAANRWRWLPKMGYPRSGFAAAWTGRQVLVWGGLTAAKTTPPHGEAYTPATGRWTALPASPLRGRAGPVAVWAGGRMIVWGGSGRTDGAVYTPAPATVSWGKATGVPGLGALNTGGNAGVGPVSCASAGNCAAGGEYTDRSRHTQGFVASEHNGVWGTAIEVPGLGALNKGDAYVNEVSCASAGDCAAGGEYTDGHDNHQGFVASEHNGVWGTAIEVPGLADLNTQGDARVDAVSCASPGNCAAGGDYLDGDGNWQGFVASERNGAWRKATGVPGLGALNEGEAEVTSVSCAWPGNCAAGGFYATNSGKSSQGFVASERNGAWGKAIEVPGLAALNQGENSAAGVSEVSCASAGNCAAGGYYTDRGLTRHGFVAVERHGAWGKAIEVPGLAALNKGGAASVWSVSCASPGNCAAGGFYGGPHVRGFLAAERNGRWTRAIPVPGLAAVNTGGFAEVLSVSCASAGNCAAGGHYTDRRQHYHGFVASEHNGVWGRAIEVPGLAALNKGGDAHIFSVSCAPAGSCTAGGWYTDRSRHSQGFVVTQAR